MSHRILLGDCLGPEGLASLADGSVGCVIMDPPFSEHVHRNLGAENRTDGIASREALSFEHLTQAVADAVAVEAARLVRRWWVIFCDERAIEMWLRAIPAAGAEFCRLGAWVKSDPMPQMSGDGPAAGSEWLIVAHGTRVAGEGRKRWNGGGRPASWRGSQRSLVAREHPNQKPEWLIESLVRDFTDPGELICDPFAGSGTTGVACKRLGRNFIGWEKDPVFHAAAVKRLDAAREQLVIPSARGPKPKQATLGLDAGIESSLPPSEEP